MTPTRLRQRLRGPLSAPLPDDAERGSAVLEFVALAVVVLVPVVLAVGVLSVVQRASYAASGAARDAARIFAAGPDPASAAARAQAAAGVVLRSYGLAEQGSVGITCAGRCLAPGTTVRATATVVVPIPGVADVLGTHRFTSVTITSSQVAPVDEFKAEP